MDLTTIVPPPGRPQFNGRPEDWGTVERTLGMELPDDYKSLVNVYGTGSFFEFLYPLTPFAPLDTALNILSRDTFRLLSAYEEGRKEYPQFSPPFRAYPHNRAIPVGDDDQWKYVVLVEGRCPESMDRCCL